MVKSRASYSSSVFAVAFFLAGIAFAAVRTNAEAVTDPKEAMALNAIFQKWNISAKMSRIEWNTSSDICSKQPSEGDIKIYDNDEDYNPGIICDCGYMNNTVCHITRLKAYNLRIVGTFPEEMSNLIYLENMQIARNYLTGPLPKFIGVFSQMQYISMGFNSFSGTLPKEIGNLTNLLSLAINQNNFSGSLPPELGNLTKLQQMYVDSAGFSGEIPPTFSKLQNLAFMVLGDNNFGGRIPDFIGNLQMLQSLEIQGNSFQGPIPSSFANLTKLSKLRLSDLSNGSSTLGFIENMTSLTTLILRNSNISGMLPSNFGKYINLTHLDLSFNNLTGQLSQSLFNLANLEHLYLGNNSITGVLPSDKSGMLLNIDLSYNDLSGSLPSWVRKDLQLNLVGNNFNIDDSNSDLPWGLWCLQKGAPCYRGSPVYYSFAINCGGDEIKEADGTDFEADNQNLSTASYYVNSNYRWAVSSVGRFLEAPNAKYTESSSPNISKTSYPQLFQSVRLSPSSLRYYGLALENGNYTVTLQFAETAFPDDLTYLSRGTRVFDIYIQGNLRVKDFNIRKEAGGKSFSAVIRNYTALVTQNFLEIHLFWAGKGSTAIPTQGYYGPSISAVSVTPNFNPTVSNHLPYSSKLSGALVAGIAVGTAAVIAFLLLLGAFVWRWKQMHLVIGEDEELRGLAIMPNTFSFTELKEATDDFNPANKLGEGGFGAVFKGKLADGRIVAVKQLFIASPEGKRQFVTEVATISAVQHRNLVKLYGCCYEGDSRLLVYEFVENNSLDHVLFGKSGFQLDWPSRFEICLGIARGLAYLHEESRIRIVHRDVKASNILLDAHLNPKISDFGLAKLYDDKMTHVSTRVAGTVGYLAPEYAMRGHLTEKADVFGFGVLALEILCGRSNTGSSLDGEIYLLEWAWQLHENNCDLEMLDQRLQSFNNEEAARMIKVAFLCTQTNFMLRPPMSRVVAMLAGDMEIGDVTSKPAYLTDWKYDDWGTNFLTESVTSDITVPSQSSMFHLSSPSRSMLTSDGAR